VQFWIDSVAVGGPQGLDNNGDGTLITSTLSATTHTVVAYYTPTGTFLASDNSASPLTQTVTRAPLTVAGIYANSKYYDGTPAATLGGTAALSGLVAGDVEGVTATLGGTPTAAFVAPDIGTGIAVTVTGYTISGSSASNYNFTQPTGLTANINAIPITSCLTLDTNSDGWIDTILVTTGAPLTDDFSSVDITVAGYSLATTPYSAGPGANQFYINLVENGAPLSGLGDTGATPSVTVNSSGSLGLAVGTYSSTDGAPPVLMSAQYVSQNAGTAIEGVVTAGDQIVLTFSEAVAVLPTLSVSNFALPVLGDSFGAGATIAQTGPTTLAITLGSNPVLTPGGTYGVPSVNTAPGYPSGIYVDNGANIADLVGNVVLSQVVGQAQDILPGSATPSICWAADGTTAPKNWWVTGGPDGTTPSSVTLGGTYDATADLGAHAIDVLNNGNTSLLLYAAITVNGSPWTPASTPGANAFGLMADNGTATYSLDLSTGPQTLNVANAGSTPPYNPLYSNNVQGFDLQLETPTSISSGGGVPQLIVVTITATVY